MKRLFIINPASATGMSASEFEKMEKYFLKVCGEFPHIITKSRDDVIIQTRKALHAGVEQIIAVGGDGTVHCVINGFFESNKPINPNALLAISNTGTGSDYYRTLTTSSKKMDWKKIVTDFTIKEVDLGYVSFTNPQNNQYFNNMASIGVSAKIVDLKNKLPSWCPTQVKYILPTLVSVMNYKARQAVIKINENDIRTNLLALFICKGIYAGGGMKFGDSPVIDDGKFAVTIVEAISPFKIIKNIKELYNNLDGFSEIKRIKTDKLQFKSDTPIGVELDGENTGEVNSFEISLIPKALKVCFPHQKDGL